MVCLLQKNLQCLSAWMTAWVHTLSIFARRCVSAALSGFCLSWWNSSILAIVLLSWYCLSKNILYFATALSSRHLRRLIVYGLVLFLNFPNRVLIEMSIYSTRWSLKPLLIGNHPPAIISIRSGEIKMESIRYDPRSVVGGKWSRLPYFKRIGSSRNRGSYVKEFCKSCILVRFSLQSIKRIILSPSFWQLVMKSQSSRRNCLRGQTSCLFSL